MDSLFINGGGYQILVVDDVAEVRQLLKQILERLGHAVLTADSANQALRMLNEFQADLIISDISMPEMDGYELVQQLRRRPDTRSCYVVAMTGNGASSSEDASQVAGFDAHLTKPFALEAVYRVLNDSKARRANDAFT